MDRIRTRRPSMSMKPTATAAASGPTYENFQPTAEWSQDSANNNLLLVHLPGFKREEISVQLDNNSGKIMVRGTRKVTEDKFFRLDQSFDVPENTIVEKISGRLENGYLTMILPFLPKPNIDDQEKSSSTTVETSKSTDEDGMQKKLERVGEKKDEALEKDKPKGIDEKKDEPMQKKDEDDKKKDEPMQKKEEDDKKKDEPMQKKDEDDKKKDEPMQKKDEYDKKKDELMQKKDEDDKKKDEPMQKKDEVDKKKDEPMQKKDEYDKKKDEPMQKKEEDDIRKKSENTEEKDERPKVVQESMEEIPTRDEKRHEDDIQKKPENTEEKKYEPIKQETAKVIDNRDELDNIQEKNKEHEYSDIDMEKNKMAKGIGEMAKRAEGAMEKISKREAEEGISKAKGIRKREPAIWRDNLLEKLKRNKKVIAVAFVALSVGFYVSHKMKKNGR